MPSFATGDFMPDVGMLIPDSGGGDCARATCGLTRLNRPKLIAVWRRYFIRRSQRMAGFETAAYHSGEDTLIGGTPKTEGVTSPICLKRPRRRFARTIDR